MVARTKNKAEKTVAGESLCRWQSPLVSMVKDKRGGACGNGQRYAHIINDWCLLLDAKELLKFVKRTVFILVIDKRLHIIFIALKTAWRGLWSALVYNE